MTCMHVSKILVRLRQGSLNPAPSVDTFCKLLCGLYAMLTVAFRAVRRNLLSIIALALVCLAISGFIPQHSPELKGQRKRAGARQELERAQQQFMGSGSSKTKANMSGVQQLVDQAIKENKVRWIPGLPLQEQCEAILNAIALSAAGRRLQQEVSRCLLGNRTA